MSANPKHVILVDDEPAAIANLRAVLDCFDSLKVVAEVGDGESAIKDIVALRPDIVFLDIEMPGVDGFEVAKETAHIKYQLVFVTAYDQYALDAFNTNAIDYLMKPVRPSLLQKCVHKMLFQEGLVLEKLEQDNGDGDTLVLSDGGATRVINQDNVSYIEGIGRYRRIHLDSTGAKVHKMDTLISDTTLDEFAAQLVDKHFVRLHRSYIVNRDKIIRLSLEDRRHFVRLVDSDLLIPVSRSKVAELKRMIGA